MISGKGIALFLVKFLTVYLILLVPWLGLGKAYAVVLRGVAGGMFRTFGSDGRVHVFPTAALSADDVPAGYRKPSDDRGLDVHLALSSRRSRGYTTYLDTSSRKFGYLPTAFVISLIAASPVSRRRRLIAAAVGLVLTQAYVMLKLWVWLLQAFSRDDAVAIFSFGRFWQGAVGGLHELLNLHVAGTYVFPLAIWMVVTFRRDDLRRVFSARRPAGDVVRRRRG